MSDKKLAIKTEFRISHYAGDVKYQINNFIDKNKDSLYQDFKRLLYNSGNAYLKQMWPEGAQSINEITKRPISVATRFKNSMIELVHNLSTKVRFINYLKSYLQSQLRLVKNYLILIELNF